MQVNYIDCLIVEDDINNSSFLNCNDIVDKHPYPFRMSKAYGYIQGRRDIQPTSLINNGKFIDDIQYNQMVGCSFNMGYHYMSYVGIQEVGSGEVLNGNDRAIITFGSLGVNKTVLMQGYTSQTATPTDVPSHLYEMGYTPGTNGVYQIIAHANASLTYDDDNGRKILINVKDRTIIYTTDTSWAHEYTDQNSDVICIDSYMCMISVASNGSGSIVPMTNIPEWTTPPANLQFNLSGLYDDKWVINFACRCNGTAGSYPLYSKHPVGIVNFQADGDSISTVSNIIYYGNNTLATLEANATSAEGTTPDLSYLNSIYVKN